MEDLAPSPTSSPQRFSEPDTRHGSVSEEDFPRMGDLVWGKLTGYPFWPGFVTKCPEGRHKKPGPFGRENYHVQFFNWNDQSSWVNSALEFDGLDSFKEITGRIFPL